MVEIPTPDQLRDLRGRYGVTQSLLAQLLHVTPRTVERWESPADAPNHRDIPAGLYELALIKLGESPLSKGYAALTGALLPPPAAPTQRRTPRQRAPRRAPEKRVSVQPKPAPTPAPPRRATPERLEQLRQLAQNTLKGRL